MFHVLTETQPTGTRAERSVPDAILPDSLPLASSFVVTQGLPSLPVRQRARQGWPPLRSCLFGLAILEMTGGREHSTERRRLEKQLSKLTLKTDEPKELTQLPGLSGGPV